MPIPSDVLNASSDELCETVLGGNFNYTFSGFNNTDVLTEEIAYILNLYLTPALVIMGIIGNLLSVIVFFKMKLRGQSTSQYLSALAISDTVFLLQLIPPWLQTIKASLFFTQNGFCQATAYFTYVSSALSSWLVVAFTVERFVAVLYPLRRPHMCTIRRARILILLIASTCLAINIPVLIFAVPTENDCNIANDLMDHAARFNVVDTIFAFSLPLAIITLLNICIIRGICKQTRARKRLVIIEKHEGARAGRVHRGRGRRGRLAKHARPVRSLQQRITRMLVTVSSVFVVLNMPAYTMRIAAYSYNMNINEYTGKWAATQQICLQFFNINFSINFLLYCMTGQNFRRALCKTFPRINRIWNSIRHSCCWWTKANQQDAAPRPAATSSFISQTETTTEAAVSLYKNIKRASSWRKRDARGRWKHEVNDDDYLELYRFDNSRQMEQQQVQNELQLYPVQMYQFEYGRPLRPVPRAPQNQLARPPTAPAIDRDPVKMFVMSSFRPIKYQLVPGQIAPLTADIPLLTPSLDPSPSPSPPSTPLPHRQHRHGAFDSMLVVHTEDHLRQCPCKYVHFSPEHGDTLLLNESGSFVPIRGPVPLARCLSAPDRARSQSQPVHTSSPLVSTKGREPRRRCVTAPASF